MTQGDSAEVLIVDDEAGMRVVLQRFVSAMGHRVHTCRSGASALELIDKGIPAEVVLSDIKMPGMDGIELLRELKARHGEVEVILFTGYAGLEIALDAIRHGAFDLIIKPFKMERLGLALGRAAERVSFHQERARLVQALSDCELECRRLTRLAGELHERAIGRRGQPAREEEPAVAGE